MTNPREKTKRPSYQLEPFYSLQTQLQLYAEISDTLFHFVPDTTCSGKLTLDINMAQHRQYRILCVGDSRLRHLQLELNDNMRNLQFVCYVFPGATLGHLSYHTRQILMSYSPYYYDFIMLTGGICDITDLTRNPSRRVTPRYNSVASTVENFERLLSLYRESTSLFTDIPIIYAPLVGIHLMRYSLDDNSVYNLQPIIDESIPLINKIIKEINRWNGLPCPDFAYTIHHSRGRQGKYRTRYGRLMDGCHPDEATRSLWSKEILKCFTNYIYA